MVRSKEYVEHPLIWSETVEARLYQQAIAERACRRNTLVILPTALGKTVISALAAAHFLYHHRDMKILVMAPTRPLVFQHKRSFGQFLRIRSEQLAVLTGKVPPSYRKHLWEGEARVFFATPQVVRNDLKQGRLSLQDFSFVVFDECHRARGRYAYTYVAKRYVEQAPYPIIMGTTASPGCSRDRIREACKNLYIEQIEFRTEKDPDVAPYIHPVDVEWRQVNLSEEYRTMRDILRRILWKRLRRLQSMGVVRKKLRYITRKDLLKAGEELRERLKGASEAEKGPIFGAIMLQAACLTAFHALGLLETQGVHPLRRFLERVEKKSDQKKSYRNILNDSDYHLLRKHLAENEALNHPKIAVLKSEIRRHLKNNPSTRILVFTQYRDTATHLVQELKSLHHVEAERFVGQASKEDDPGLSQEEQAQILQDFREGNLNVLVATSIAEEGLDIPAVDLVLFYEPIPSGIRHIQRKGRTGRKNIGRTVILAAKETADIAYLYASKRRIQKMRSIVTGLETQLPDFPRKGVKPPSNPMPKSMIAEEKPSEAPEGRVQEDVEELRRFNRQVDRVAKSLWMKVMKAGAEGLSVEALQEGLLSDYSTSVIKAAIDRLQEAEQIIKLGSDRIASAASLKGTEDKESYQVEVERILPGRAVCLINDRWRARLLPEEYEGPSQLIKKNMRFRATGNLFRDGDTLCLRVRRVTRIL